MQKTSQEWKDLHKETLLPESFVQIIMPILVNDTGKATIDPEIETTFSNSDVILNNLCLVEPTPHAVLEPNSWCLDGSFELYSDLNIKEAPGFVNAIMLHNSSAGIDYGYFKIDFEKTITEEIPGITITWSREYDEYATEYWVTFLEGGNGKTTKIYDHMEGTTQIIDCPCDTFDGIEITVFRWSIPDRRVRIESLQIGHAFIFDKNEIIEYTHEQSISPYGFELPTNNISFTVSNLDGKWSPLNDNGYRKYLFKGLPITTRYGMKVGDKIEWILGGRFYLTEWRVPSSDIVANFVAKDVFAAFMSDVELSYIGLQITTNESTQFYDSYLSETPSTYFPPPGSKLFVRGWYTRGNETYYSTDYGWVLQSEVERSTVTAESFLLDIAKRCGVPPSVKFYFPTNWESLEYHMDLGSDDSGEATGAELFQLLFNKTGLSPRLYRDGSVGINPSYAQNTESYDITLKQSYSHPEIESVEPVKQIEFKMQDNYTRILHLQDTGDTLVIDNRFLKKYWVDHMPAFLNNYKNYNAAKQIISGEFRADPRLDVIDNVQLETKYGNVGSDIGEWLTITHIKYTYTGSFRGEYRGRRYVSFSE